MKLTQEYQNQLKFRDWPAYLKQLGIRKQDTILDLGCSIGEVTRLLAEKAETVIGIDNHPDLLEYAQRRNGADNITYLRMDLTSPDINTLPPADGIWSSFVVAYFPDFKEILSRWIALLKPNGWIALIEMSDLFGHQPLSTSVRDVFRDYYDRQRKNKLYDFEMGSRLKGFMAGAGLKIIHDESVVDRELSFNGPAVDDVLRSWDHRFERMTLFREFIGEELFSRIKTEFLECLSDMNHVSKTTVKFIIGQKK